MRRTGSGPESARGTYRKAHPDRIAASRRKWEEANPERKLLAHLKSRAKRRHLAFNLTLDDIVIPAVCPVLGIKIVRSGKQSDHAPSIDRIDNTGGYVRGNVIVISWRANRLKSDATLEELAKIAAFYAGKRP